MPLPCAASMISFGTVKMPEPITLVIMIITQGNNVSERLSSLLLSIIFLSFDTVYRMVSPVAVWMA